MDVNKELGGKTMYYGGIDLGTSSIGWALTDVNYNLVRKKGKDLWGVRLFDEANTAQERRTHRVSRRRRAREVARIGMLKEYFADAIDAVDPGFYQRLEESKYHRDEDVLEPKYAIFVDAGFIDKEYYQRYKTIYHLRKELIESEEAHDVRLVYLAVLNLFKNRGHFLNSYITEDEKEEGFSELYSAFWNSIPEELRMVFPEVIDVQKVEEILSSKDYSRTVVTEKLADILQISKSQNKPSYEVLKLLCGLSGKLANIFGKDILGEAFANKSLDFRGDSYEEVISGLAEVLPSEYIDMLENAKAVHDKGVLGAILKGYTYLSHARVAIYNKHAEDLRKLRVVLKKYCPECYDDYFRVMSVDNYSGYIGSVNSQKEKVRRGGHDAKKEAYKSFWKRTSELLSVMPADDEDVIYLKDELQKDTLLPKQRTKENSVIPNQVHLRELKKILSNAEIYLSFLKDVDESGLTVTERIIRLYQFQIPYYVGPLHINAGEEGNKWVVRKEQGKVLPWNLEEKVDIAETRKAFIERMVRRCTYLSGKNVLPKGSLLYERFMVLNELNNVRINGCKLSIEMKQQIYDELFAKGKKISLKNFCTYLFNCGVIDKADTEMITGIDGGFNHTLTSYSRFYSVFGDKIKLHKYQRMAEEIIFTATVYSNDKKLLKELIAKKYGNPEAEVYISKEQEKKILGFKWSDWGRLSKEFLEIKGCSKEDGVEISLIRAMWECDCNLMEALGDKFTFGLRLLEMNESRDKLLSDFTYEDLQDGYLSAPVKRMTWQTILVLKELCQVMGEAPKKLFVEMPRSEGEKGKRTTSRKQKLMDLYRKCKEESHDWISEIDGYTDDQLRSKKLYLYYTQQGRCMYTGNAISLADLLSGNGRYDIDHIYPRHFVKDDSIENNLVLVEKESNAYKSDNYPIDANTRSARYQLWKYLRDNDFISEEKYTRLTRSWDFTNEELAGFINRQIVETGQATKCVAHLLQELLPETEVVYVKAGNVSDFRREKNLLKTRSVNEFHHAQDAYLNIVVGNVYNTKFTKNSIIFVANYKKNNEKYRYHMGKMYEHNVERDGLIAWMAGESGSIVTVRKMMAKNTPLLTKRTYEVHGGIAEQTLYSAKVANASKYIPLKGKDERMGDVTKYGGLSAFGTYYFLVEHEKKKKVVRTIEQMPLYLKEVLEVSEEALRQYCVDKLGLVNPNVRLGKIPMRTLVKRNGYWLRIGGRTGNQLYADNAVSLCLNMQWINYIHDMERFLAYGKAEDGKHNISYEKNIQLYEELYEKHLNGIFSNKPNAIGNKLMNSYGNFEKLTLKEQIKVLLELLKATQYLNLSIDAKEIDLKMSSIKISNDVSGQDEFLLINQSVTGIYTSVIDLRTV